MAANGSGEGVDEDIDDEDGARVQRATTAAASAASKIEADSAAAKGAEVRAAKSARDSAGLYEGDLTDRTVRRKCGAAEEKTAKLLREITDSTAGDYDGKGLLRDDELSIVAALASRRVKGGHVVTSRRLVSAGGIIVIPSHAAEEAAGVGAIAAMTEARSAGVDRLVPLLQSAWSETAPRRKGDEKARAANVAGVAFALGGTQELAALLLCPDGAPDVSRQSVARSLRFARTRQSKFLFAQSSAVKIDQMRNESRISELMAFAVEHWKDSSEPSAYATIRTRIPLTLEEEVAADIAAAARRRERVAARKVQAGDGDGAAAMAAKQVLKRKPSKHRAKAVHGVLWVVRISSYNRTHRTNITLQPPFRVANLSAPPIFNNSRLVSKRFGSHTFSRCALHLRRAKSGTAECT